MCETERDENKEKRFFLGDFGNGKKKKTDGKFISNHY